jgi:hypothetical protein
MNIKLTPKNIIFIALLCFSSLGYSSSLELFKGVIVDLEDKQVFLSNPNGGLDSVEATNGNLIWHSDEADFPLYFENNKLISSVNNNENGILKLVSSEVKDGKTIQQFNYSLPKEVKTNVQHTLENKFNLFYKPNSTSNIQINWEYTNQVSQGMLSIEPRKPLRIQGNLQLSDSDDLSKSVLNIDQKPTKKPNKNIESKFLDQIEGRQFKSLSGNYILVSTVNSKHNIWDKYNWEIYDLESNKIGSIDNFTSFRPFVIIADAIVFVDIANERLVKDDYRKTPLSVKAYSLKTAELIWKNEIRDFSYNGPYPH